MAWAPVGLRGNPVTRLVACAALCLLPWSIRRHLLSLFFGYRLHPTCRIGFALVAPQSLVMGAHSYIGHLTVARGLRALELANHATIGRLNWITAYPKDKHQFFKNDVDRDPSLLLGPHAAITHRHIIDCTDQIAIGPFTTIAGYRSQVITHSIEPGTGSQHAKPIRIGEYCFVGTSCVILGGASLPGYSILSAMSLLNHQFVDTYALYGGVPAKKIKPLSPELPYFNRSTGVVY